MFLCREIYPGHAEQEPLGKDGQVVVQHRLAEVVGHLHKTFPPPWVGHRLLAHSGSQERKGEAYRL